jgi:hypothetical protein
MLNYIPLRYIYNYCVLVCTFSLVIIANNVLKSLEEWLANALYERTETPTLADVSMLASYVQYRNSKELKLELAR